MDIRAEVKPAILGAIGGAVVLAVIGFAWGGWVTAAKARDLAEKNAETAVVSMLAPICVHQFRADPAAAAKLDELSKLPGYDQGPFVEKGGWAVMPGTDKAVSGVARGCASILTAKS